MALYPGHIYIDNYLPNYKLSNIPQTNDNKGPEYIYFYNFYFRHALTDLLFDYGISIQKNQTQTKTQFLSNQQPPFTNQLVSEYQSINLYSSLSI